MPVSLFRRRLRDGRDSYPRISRLTEATYRRFLTSRLWHRDGGLLGCGLRNLISRLSTLFIGS